LRLSNARVRDALQLLCEVGSWRFETKAGVIVIGSRALVEAPLLEIYDFSDLTADISSNRAPANAVNPFIHESYYGAANPFIKAPTVMPTLTNIADMIRQSSPARFLGSSAWHFDRRARRQTRRHKPAAVHAEIRSLIGSFRLSSRRQIQTAARMLTISSADLDRIRAEAAMRGIQGLELDNVALAEIDSWFRPVPPFQFSAVPRCFQIVCMEIFNRCDRSGCSPATSCPVIS